MTAPSATLEIDLAALAGNYRLLTSHHAKQSCAAVVKADAYGLGVEHVSQTLWQEGCEEFFVATLEEGIELRRILPKAWIAVFQGILPGEETEYWQHRLVPVINDLPQIERLKALKKRDPSAKAIVHIDTGMTRLGLSASDLKSLKLPKDDCSMVMSHLACASEAGHPKNEEQFSRFKAALKHFPNIPASLCNSSGLFLDSKYHFDLGRPGCALYGITPVSGKNPMRHVATLSAPILQVRTLDRDETVGYGATVAAPSGAKIAIVALGYADGYFRMLGNKGRAWIGGEEVALFGRVSMDMVALDVSGLSEKDLASGRAEFINAHYTVTDLAEACGTIGYEIFTRIGARVKRVYE